MSKKFIQDLTCGKVDCFHSAELAHALHQQWLTGEYCDLKITVEDRQYSVHKCIMAHYSAKFCDELDRLETIRLIGVTKYGFEKVLEFMYKGKMSKLASINLPEFQEIMKAADALNSSKVIKYCIQERCDLVQSLNRNALLDATNSKNDGWKCKSLEDCEDRQPAFASVRALNDTSAQYDEGNGSSFTDIDKEDEDPLRDSEGSLVECLAGDGEIGKDMSSGLNTALSAVNKTLSGEELASLLDVPVHPLDLYQEEASSSRTDQTNAKRSSMMDGWQKKFQCSVCKNGFMSDALLQHHMEMHKKEQYSCELCGSKFRFQIAYLSHMKEHKQSRAICKICDKAFKFNSSLKQHMEKNHPAAHKTLVSISESQAAVVASMTDVSRRVDLALVIEIIDQMQSDSEGKFVCPLCERGFSRKWNLRYHILKHSEDQALWPKPDPKRKCLPHQCNECDASFQKDTGLHRHKSIMHRDNYISTTKPLVLLSSKKKQSRKSVVVTEVSFWCDICGKGFKRQRNLVSHMETHTGSGFQCPICGRSFSQKDSLHGHLWVHGGFNGSKDVVGQRRQTSSQKPSSNHVPIEGEVVVLGSTQDADTESLDLTSQESVPDNFSDNDESLKDVNVTSAAVSSS